MDDKVIYRKPGKKTVGVIGYRGFVGSAIFEVFSSDDKYETIGIGSDGNVTGFSETLDLIINADGNSSKILADKDPIKDFDMNVNSSLRFLKGFNYVSYIHISTSEVYNDVSNHELTKESAEIDVSQLSNYGVSKLCSEALVKHYAREWIILRLGGMVGKNMKKGPVYDIINLHKLFVSPNCRYQFINTLTVAHIAKQLFERGRYMQIYNVSGKGNVQLSDIAKLAGIKLESFGDVEYTYNVNIDKIGNEFDIPSTTDTITRFLGGQE